MRMRDKSLAVEFQRRAEEIRTIALGVYDDTERQILLEFVKDSEKLAAEIASKTRG
jgi:hypothetical protein